MSVAGPHSQVTNEKEIASPRPWLLLVCVLVAVAACYAPVLGAPFVWDDQHLVDSPLVKVLHPLGEYFSGSFWQHDSVGVLRSYYRPLVILSLALDHRIFADNPGGFHVTNLVVHLLATSILFRLLRRDGATGYAAACGCALWALSPRLTEAAAWIAGRTDVFAGFFVLAALLVSRSTSKLARIGSASLLLLGLFCKETALAGVLAVLVQELRGSGSGTARLGRLIPTFAAVGVYASFRDHALGALSNALSLPLAKRGPAVAEAIGRYVWMLLTPWWPDAQIGRLRVRATVFVLLGGVSVGAALVWAWRRRERLAAEQAGYLALGLGALSLALYAIPFSFNAVAADRFLYLPLAAVTLLATPVLTRWSVRLRALPALAFSLVLSFGVATFLRAEAWADEVDFWSATFRRHPEEPSMSAVALGRIFSREGSVDKALGLFRLGSEPGMDCEELARTNTATVFLGSGQYKDAVHVLVALANQHPKTSSTFVNLALAETYLGHFEAARAALERAPNDAAARSLRDRLPELAMMRQELDSLAPSEAVLSRARLQEKLGLTHEALESYRAALAAWDATPQVAEEATWLALRKGDAATRAAFFARYTMLAGQNTDPRVALAYGVHRDTLAKLERAWLALGLR